MMAKYYARVLWENSLEDKELGMSQRHHGKSSDFQEGPQLIFFTSPTQVWPSGETAGLSEA